MIKASLVVLKLVATVLVVAVFAIVLTELSPGSVGERAARAAGVLPPNDSGLSADLRAELADRVAKAHGLSDSLTERVTRRVAGLMTLDFGRSWRSGRPVASSLRRPVARTLGLVLAALLLALGIGIFIAVSQSLLDRGSTLIATLVAAAVVTPPVWLALLLLRLSDSAGVVFAVISLAVLPAAVISRHAHSALRELLAAPHTTSARARGVSRRRLVVVHGAPPMASAVLSLLPGLVGSLVGGAMVVETVFGVRGMGALLAEAALIGDAPVVIAVVVITAFAVVATSALTRTLAPLCDPRLRATR